MISFEYFYIRDNFITITKNINMLFACLVILHSNNYKNIKIISRFNKNSYLFTCQNFSHAKTSYNLSYQGNFITSLIYIVMRHFNIRNSSMNSLKQYILKFKIFILGKLFFFRKVQLCHLFRYSIYIIIF